MEWPKWAEDFYSKFRANVAHQFLLYGNVEDYVCCQDNLYLKMSNFLSTFLRTWKTPWDIIVFYNCAGGLRFADEQDEKPVMRDKFYQTVGRPKPEEVAVRFQQLGGQAISSKEARQPQDVLPLLEKLLQNKTVKSVVVIEYTEAIAPNGDLAMLLPEKVEAIVTFQRWALSTEINEAGNLVILLAEKLFDLHPDIRDITSKTEVIEVPFPGPKERANWIEFYLKYRHPNVQIEVSEIERITTGFNLLTLEDLWLRAKESRSPVTLSMIKNKKQEIQKAESSDLLAIIDPEDDFDQIGGLQRLKDEFRFLARRLKEGDPTVPSGGLLLGPPGTGKSVLARALAKEVDIPLIQFLDIQEKWVGASERNMRRALESIRRYDQAIVFIDEFDQAYGGRGGLGDSGVTSRLFGTLLEFMGDPKNRGKIFWLGATNRPDRIDPAMKRPGRFSRQYLLFPPDASDREDIFKVMYDRRLKIRHQIRDFSEAVSKTEGFTGAEIEEVCNRSKDFAERDGRKVVTEKDLLRAIEDFIPAQDPSYELMTLLAVRCCNSKRQIPEPYRAMSMEEIDKRILTLKSQLGMLSPNVWGL
jgi:SpoVK/Ycf46/Vps4 family AAA+-type ATPase